MIKKESRQFNISVEGINCEKLYFEHLAKLINNSDRSTYNLKVDPLLSAGTGERFRILWKERSYRMQTVWMPWVPSALPGHLPMVGNTGVRWQTPSSISTTSFSCYGI